MSTAVQRRNRLAQHSAPRRFEIANMSDSRLDDIRIEPRQPKLTPKNTNIIAEPFFALDISVAVDCLVARTFY